MLIGQPAVHPRHQLKARTPEQFRLSKNTLIISVSYDFVYEFEAVLAALRKLYQVDARS